MQMPHTVTQTNDLSRTFGALQLLHCFHDARACTLKNPVATEKALDRMLR
jgi:hypothetical protein